MTAFVAYDSFGGGGARAKAGVFKREGVVLGMSAVDGISADEPVPPTIDTTKPSIARVYDMFLGGKDHYEVDREVYRRTMEISPEVPLLTRAFRQWLIRVVRFLASGPGIDQILDCGSGLPTAENTHQVAQRVRPETTVVYVDNDPMVIAHGRALLEENDRTHFVDADLRDPEALLAHPAVTRYLDMNRPLALMQCATLHHVSDEDNPGELMARYIEALPSGSYVAISHFCDPADGSEMSELARMLETNLRNAVGSGWCRTYSQIESLFCGLELVEPGLVPAADWWPDGPRVRPLSAVEHIAYGAVARKP
ncbi:SAM-dependent methyltransferase [Kibdelosporangium aridum]|nr:SAM-dependent methyltransferase [Kibdelosporangium aridum]